MGVWPNSQKGDSTFLAINSSPDKMDAILQTNFNFHRRISIQFSLKFVHKGPTDKKSALVKVMACRPLGVKPLPEPMLTQFSDAYMRHKGEMS